MSLLGVAACWIPIFVLGVSQVLAASPVVIYGKPRFVPYTGRPAYHVQWYPYDNHGLIQVVLDPPLILPFDAFTGSVHLSAAETSRLVSPAPPEGCSVIIRGTLHRDAYSPIGVRLNGAPCQNILTGLQPEDVEMEFIGLRSSNGEAVEGISIRLER